MVEDENDEVLFSFYRQQTFRLITVEATIVFIENNQLNILLKPRIILSRNFKMRSFNDENQTNFDTYVRIDLALFLIETYIIQ